MLSFPAHTGQFGPSEVVEGRSPDSSHFASDTRAMGNIALGSIGEADPVTSGLAYM